MASNLVIVESPAKAKTIEGYLGKDFIVKSSFGHVRDLKSKELSIDVNNGFIPDYQVSEDKKKLVAELTKAAKSVDVVWLATDEDREGEAISWHLMETLKLKEDVVKRITFNEITKKAVLVAIENPRKIDIDLVNAQQARRILDRLVGFELSPVLWRKIKPSLSAGRVQSVAVRLIVEREREIENFKEIANFKVTATFITKDGKSFTAELQSRLESEEAVIKFLEKCVDADFTIGDVVMKPAKKSPSAPFTTSTLQQEASRKLGYSVVQTMRVAQKLYESGKITYMRTDSVHLSETAIEGAKNKIIDEFGQKYSRPRNYATKSLGAQEAHEAIRPSNFDTREVSGDNSEQKLYKLIWNRTIASQMTDALLEKTVAEISGSGIDKLFIAKGEVTTFDGFMKVYQVSTDEDTPEELKNALPYLHVGDHLLKDSIIGVERFTHHPARYSEAALVRKMEELGIGRPSTYAPTISTIQKRGYIVKENREGYARKFSTVFLKDKKITTAVKSENTGEEKGKLFPSDIGLIVNDFLIQNFGTILEYNFTASIEKEFDEIALGKLKWNTMIEQFYKPFHATIDSTIENAEKARGERILGQDSVSGKPIVAKIGRFGPMVQIGSGDDEEKPKFASLQKGQSLTSITLEQALDLFKLPHELGEYKGKKVIAAIGKYGPYVRFGSTFVSLKKDIDDPLKVTLTRAIELIDEKQKELSNMIINVFDNKPEIRVLNGKYGPYIKMEKKNFRIPKNCVANELTLEDCLEIINSSDKKKKK